MKHIVALLLAVVVAGCGGHGAPESETDQTDQRTEAKKEIVEREVIVRLTIYDLMGKQIKQFYVTKRFDGGYVNHGENYMSVSDTFRFKNVTYTTEFMYKDTLDPTIKVIGSKEDFWDMDRTGETEGL